MFGILGSQLRNRLTRGRCCSRRSNCAVFDLPPLILDLGAGGNKRVDKYRFATTLWDSGYNHEPLRWAQNTALSVAISYVDVHRLTFPIDGCWKEQAMGQQREGMPMTLTDSVVLG